MIAGLDPVVAPLAVAAVELAIPIAQTTSNRNRLAVAVALNNSKRAGFARAGDPRNEHARPDHGHAAKGRLAPPFAPSQGYVSRSRQRFERAVAVANQHTGVGLSHGTNHLTVDREFTLWIILYTPNYQLNVVGIGEDDRAGT